MRSVNIKASGAINSRVNNKIVANFSVSANYDGSELNIVGSENGKQFYLTLDNDNIADILAMPAHSASLEERLIHDFGSVDKKHTKRHKHIKPHKHTKPHKYTKPHHRGNSHNRGKALKGMRKTLATRKKTSKKSKKSTRRK